MIGQLLDTQALLWELVDDDRLPEWIKTAIDADPSSFGVSDVSLWEIAIKASIGKLHAHDDLPHQIKELGLHTVPITGNQVWSVRNLPTHHMDPFDRLLVAQALDLGVPVVTGDSAFGAYNVGVLW